MSSLVNLLLNEREHSSLWWAALNEMRLSGDLPQRLSTQNVGTAADREHYDEAQRETNIAVFGTSLILPGDLLDVTESDRQTLIDLIEAERTFAIRWWTRLNDLRRKGQLPDWALSLAIGHEPDMDRWRDKAGAVNLALFNTDYVRESTTSARAAAHWLKYTLT